MMETTICVPIPTPSRYNPEQESYDGDDDHHHGQDV